MTMTVSKILAGIAGAVLALVLTIGANANRKAAFFDWLGGSASESATTTGVNAGQNK